MAVQRRFTPVNANTSQPVQQQPNSGFGGLLGLTRPQFGGAGNFFGLEQGFLGDLFGQGFGSLFGGANGLVNFGGGNFFQPGQGFFQQAAGPIAQTGAAAGQIPTASGFNVGNFLGSLFG